MRSFRKERVAKAVREIVGGGLMRRLNDPRIELLTTVTRVEMSADLQIARVYLTVPGGDAVERRTMAGVKQATGFLQRMVAAGLSIRHCPELRFELDDSAKIAAKTLSLLDQNRRAFEQRSNDTTPDQNAENPDTLDAADTADRSPNSPGDSLGHSPSSSAADTPHDSSEGSLP